MSSTMRARTPPVDDVVGQRRRAWTGTGSPWSDALVVAVIATLVTGAGCWVPSATWDEGATVSAATRSWSELFALARTVDLVHLAWYATMHCWFDLVGYSPLALRAVSVLCVGATAGLVTVLGRMLLDRSAGLLAGAFFVLLPRVTLSATDGRSGAASAFVSVLLTLVLVTVAGRLLREHGEDPLGRRPRTTLLWTLYGIMAVLAVVVFLHDALMLVVHAIAVAVWATRSPDRTASRRLAVGFVSAAGGAAVVCVPFVRLAAAQVGQVSWLHRPDLGTVKQIVVEQWFSADPPFAVLGVLLVGVGLARCWRERSTTGPLLVAWLLVPTIMLLAVSVVWTPVYQARYLAFCSPAVALLAAVAIRGWRPSRIVVVLVLAAVLSAPAYARQRTEEGKDTDWARVARESSAVRAAPTTTAALYGDVEGDADSTLDVIPLLYPRSFPGAVDCRAGRSADTRDTLFPSRRPLSQALRCARGHRTVWLVTTREDRPWRSRVVAALTSAGYRIDVPDRGGATSVMRFHRDHEHASARGR
ncbi:hypothetical protein [Curtobacterium sp. MCBD17_028]|uniref:glycosyltransferase family 39 protein n=1 Tax=Curtobacterium sp. MCBD17_028 TaxID=2175670 RepID=UPI000DA704C2|nr:hypothetical protein [Curtobacterium sp. MCBD17_028]PZE27353.1 hypothetical protein DEI86_07675 [Curtobacterium sp. MCBD17_028]